MRELWLFRIRISPWPPQLQVQRWCHQVQTPSHHPQRWTPPPPQGVTLAPGHHGPRPAASSPRLTPSHSVYITSLLEKTLLYAWDKKKYSLMKRRVFVIKYLCLKSSLLSSQGSKPFWRRSSTVVIIWFICRSGLIQRCSYSIFPVSIHMNVPRSHLKQIYSLWHCRASERDF